MTKRIKRPDVRDGYDLWAESYDTTENPLVALDRRVTLGALQPRRGEVVLDAGCGTGVHLAAISIAKSRPVGLDFSDGMLRVARRRVPRAGLVQADLNRGFPVRPRSFDAVLSALVSEHLSDLGRFFRESFFALRKGGRLVFSAFHPELALSGVEANFEQGGTEYRLGAEPYTVSDYLNRISDAGFRNLEWTEHRGDDQLAQAVPRAQKYVNRPLLLLVRGQRTS
jgi:ubiquinone/menaquinone biosynthesis C-methylase UbiE